MSIDEAHPTPPRDPNTVSVSKAQIGIVTSLIGLGVLAWTIVSAYNEQTHRIDMLEYQRKEDRGLIHELKASVSNVAKAMQDQALEFARLTTAIKRDKRPAQPTKR